MFRLTARARGVPAGLLSRWSKAIARFERIRVVRARTPVGAQDAVPQRASAPASSRHGAAAVELALLLPLLLTLVLACIDFGRFAYTYIAVTNAARAGAGYAVLNPTTTANEALWKGNIRQVVAGELQQLRALKDPTGNTTDFYDDAKLAVNVTRTVENSGLWRVTVQVQYPFETFVPWPWLPTSIDVGKNTAPIVMRGIR